MPTPIAVYGATGHTGTLVAAELSHRGHEVVLGGRSHAALDVLRDRLDTQAEVVPAALDDRAALRELTARAAVVINCAGPFATTGEPVASAAIATGTHYLDHSAEPMYVKRVFDTLSAGARSAGVVVVPGMSFYGALADLLAERTVGDLPRVDELTVGYAIRGWRMTAASKATALALVGSERLQFTSGSLQVAPARTELASFAFPGPIGSQPVIVDYPAAEVLTIPRHVAARTVRIVMTADTFASDTVFDSDDIDPTDRAASSFVLAVLAALPGSVRRGHLEGHDIYGTGAAVAVEAATRLAADTGSTPRGVLAAAEAFPAVDFLDTLAERGVLHGSETPHA
jgi:short subunit dehydrogenase-like uncharacterized protein